MQAQTFLMNKVDKMIEILRKFHHPTEKHLIERLQMAKELVRESPSEPTSLYALDELLITAQQVINEHYKDHEYE